MTFDLTDILAIVIIIYIAYINYKITVYKDVAMKYSMKAIIKWYRMKMESDKKIDDFLKKIALDENEKTQ